MANLLQKRTGQQTWGHQKKQIQAWDIGDLDFTEPALGKLRVVIAEETWEKNQWIDGQFRHLTKQSHWRWLVVDPDNLLSTRAVWTIGHRRWGVENDAFNELTQHYHLTHCPHHQPVAIMACLLIKVLAFNLFELFVRLNGKLLRLSRCTLKEVARSLDLALERWEDLVSIWNG
ncbi:MAG: transposase [Verrucomicrobiae bacterium]|nr:transposase [Verrucomicrobiae bacterium]